MVKTGWFGNHRSLKEQMMGLAQALEETRGKTVLDVGCAEGLIGLEFKRAGAKQVDGVDNNEDFVRCALRNGMRVLHASINEPLPEGLLERYDIVLALAVLHKSNNVPLAVERIARLASDLMVVRLPHGSTGVLKAKHFDSVCDLNVDLPRHGFKLDLTEQGPREELVQYWRRR